MLISLRNSGNNISELLRSDVKSRIINFRYSFSHYSFFQKDFYILILLILLGIV